MLAAVTGATGFIGRRLVALLLERGDSVRILSRGAEAGTEEWKSVAVHRGDLADENQGDVLARFVDGTDVLYHCAGHIKSTSAMVPVHVDGTTRLLAASAGRIGHWVQLSSVGVYGPQPQGCVTEETLLNPVSLYERTKLQSDELVQGRGGPAGFSYAILRPSNVFGPGMTNQALFQLIGAIQRRLFFFIGGRGAYANYIAVDNVVDALVRCATMPQARGRVYNLSDFRPLEQFVTTIAAALGVPPPRLRFPEAPVRLAAQLLGTLPRMPLTESRIDALMTRATYSARRIESELSYSHQVSLEEALLDLVGTWKRKHGIVSA
jgi:nucleoside-diphosphate-sugar epimerase